MFKTVVKCQDGDMYDPETGFLMCIAKKVYGNKGKFNDVIKEHVPRHDMPSESFLKLIGVLKDE